MQATAHGASNVVPFEPLDHDVVSTKLRSWNRSHPGNVFYNELLKEYAEKANQDAEEPTPEEDERTDNVNEYAERIIQIITKDRKGRFLKIMDGEKNPESCLLMDHKQALHKVVHGLKNKQIALKKEQQTPGTKPEAPKSPQKSLQPKAPKSLPKLPMHPKKEQIKKRKSDPAKPASKKRKLDKSPKKPKVIYEAKQGESIQINPYALELITYVCNNQRTLSNTSILEKPISKYTIPEEEPDKERMIRLQLRHRFFSAKAVEMPVVEFARRLLEVWGGSLLETTQKPEAVSPQKTGRQLSSADTMLESNPGSQAPETPNGTSQPQEKAEKQQTDMPSKVPNPLEVQNEAIEPENAGSISPHEQQKPSEAPTLESATQQYAAATTNGSAPAVPSDIPAVASSSGNSLVQNVMKSVAAVSKAMLWSTSRSSSEPSDGNAVAKRTGAGEDEHNASLEIKEGAKQAVDSGDEECARAKSKLEDHEEKNEELEYNDSMGNDEEEANDQSSGVGDEDQGNASQDEGLDNGEKNGGVTDDEEAEDDDEATATEDDDDGDDEDDDDGKENGDGKDNDETSAKSSDTVQTDI